MFERFRFLRVVVLLCLAAVAAVRAQPVSQKDVDFGLPLGPAASEPPVFRTVERTAVPDSGKASTTLTDSVKSSGTPRSVAGATLDRDSGPSRATKPEPDRRLVRPKTQEVEPPRIVQGTAMAVTGVLLSSFGLYYWGHHSEMDDQAQEKDVNPLGLALVATATIPVGTVLALFGIAQLF